MENPFRSEAAAFRFTMLTLAALAAIVVAKVVLGNIAGIVVAAAIGLAVAFAYLRARSADRPAPAVPTRRGGEDERRILVVANETVGGETLRNCIRKKTADVAEKVLVVTPALNSPLRHWLSDEDGARAAAAERLEQSVGRLRELGIDARGEIGDADPLQAMEDALRTFGADEIIISTHPEGRSHWLERGVVSAARERFAVPITHVVVDVAAETEEIRG